MNAFWGADTDQLEQHATAMHTAAQRLVELQEQLCGEGGGGACRLRVGKGQKTCALGAPSACT